MVFKKTLKEFQAIYNIQRWFRWYRFFRKYRNLFEKVLGLPENHDSVLGKMYPKGGDLYKETYKSFKFNSLLKLPLIFLKKDRSQK
jgi:hypothetical protein